MHKTNSPVPQGRITYTVIWKQMLICSIIITAVEFTSGLILNVWLGLGIWDYSNMPFNILGQIC